MDSASGPSPGPRQPLEAKAAQLGDALHARGSVNACAGHRARREVSQSSAPTKNVKTARKALALDDDEAIKSAAPQSEAFVGRA
uniref:Uncharacterized protein n=1 Tax=Mycena chlorophos TaxID=658473 RepID=A0ABQ0LF88_MYCCL|nr:predicted protein [Mycena chlorophos]